MSLGNLKLRVGIDVSGLERGLKRASRAMRKGAGQITQIADKMTMGVTVPLAGIGVASIQAAAKLQSMQSALTTITGSADEARRQFKLLRQDALDNPGLTLEAAVDGVTRLQAVGISAEQSRDTVNEFANAMASVGNTDLGGVTLALTQIASKGKVFAEEINQINERVPQVRKVLIDAFDTARTEEIQAMNISAEDFIATLTDGFKELPRAQQTLTTGFKNFGDTVKLSLGELGASIANTIRLQDLFVSITKTISALTDRWKNLDVGIQRAVLTFVAVFGAIGPVVAIVTRLGGVLAIVTSPITLVVTGIAALAAAAVYAYGRFDNFRGVVHGLGAVMGELGKIAAEVVTNFVDGFQAIKQGNIMDGLKSIGKGIIKSNPVNLALFEGERLADSFRNGFKEGSEKEPIEVIDFFDQAAKGLGSLTGGSGGIKKAGIDAGKQMGKGLKEGLSFSFQQSFTFSGQTPTLPSGTTSNTDTGPLPSIAPSSDRFIKGIDHAQSRLEKFYSWMAPTIEDVNEKQDQFNSILERTGNVVLEGVTEAFNSMFDAILSGGDNAFKAFGNALKQVISQLVKAVATAAALAAIFTIIAPAAGGLSKIKGFLNIGDGKSLFGGLLGGLVPFADGGIVTKPTNALIGEAGPEAVIPLDQLDAIGAKSIEIEGILTGENIYLSNKRVMERMKRNRG